MKEKALAIALPAPVSTQLLLKRALEFTPELDVAVCCHYSNELDVLTQLGAQEVVQPEFADICNLTSPTVKLSTPIFPTAVRTSANHSARVRQAHLSRSGRRRGSLLPTDHSLT